MLDKSRIQWSKKPWNFGIVLIALSSVATLALGIFSGLNKPITVFTGSILSTLAIFANIAATYLFNLKGQANPTLARSVVRRLINLIRKMNETTSRIEEVVEKDDELEIKQSLREMNIHIIYFRQELEQQVFDWEQFHKDAIQELLEDYKSIDPSKEGNK